MTQEKRKIDLCRCDDVYRTIIFVASAWRWLYMSEPLDFKAGVNICQELMTRFANITMGKSNGMMRE